ncbi:75_t:CDS:2, partial [Gigaspora margarita]
DKETTKKQKEKNKGKTFLIVNWFGKQDCYDTYRTLNLQAKIEDIACFTGSNHNAPLAKINLDHLTANYSRAIAKKKEALEKSILETTIKHILKKKIYKTKATRDGKKKSRLNKLIVELGKWVRKDKKKIGSDMTEEDRKQGRMIASLLEKPFNHTVVDKLLENQNNTRVLICDPKKVKEKTKEFFQKQFRKGVLIAMLLEKNGHKSMPY